MRTPTTMSDRMADPHREQVMTIYLVTVRSSTTEVLRFCPDLAAAKRVADILIADRTFPGEKPWVWGDDGLDAYHSGEGYLAIEEAPLLDGKDEDKVLLTSWSAR